MVKCLEKCVAQVQLPSCAADAIDIKGLKAKDVGLLRAMLKGWVAKKGLPRGEQQDAFSRRIAEQVPEHCPADFAEVLLKRTAGLDTSNGLDCPEDFTKAVLENEVRTSPASLVGKKVPDAVARKLHMCVINTPQMLVDKGLIASSEMLGALVPRISAEVTGACLQDPALRRLHFALKAAFAKRRGLMLLTTEHQVRIHEIPWYTPIEQEIKKAGGAVERSLQTLREVVKMALEGFPETMLPNKLIQTLRDLAKGAKLDLDFVEEMPVDIFQGKFSPKFTSASAIAAQLLQGTLYETYYGLADDYKMLSSGVGKNYSLVATCARRAGLRKDWSYGSCGETGTVVEQQLVLTTHNLASLFTALQVNDFNLSNMALRCTTWVYRTLAVAAGAGSHERLMHTKNAAYAWRQLLFFVSMIGQVQKEQQDEVLSAVFSGLRKKDSKCKSLNAKIEKHLISSLEKAIAGEPPKQPFLGWTSQRQHWFWAEENSEQP